MAATAANVGKRFAIVLKSKGISAPVVRQPILGGRDQISGAFTVEQTRKLADQIKIAARPVTAAVIEEHIER